jgi:O-antigen ligase
LEAVHTIESLSTRAFGPARAAALPAGAAALLAVAASSAGGYFPTSWSWIGVLLGWVAALALLVGREIAFTKLGLVVLGALTAFVAWVALSIAWSEDLPQTVLEVERDLVYPLALLTVLIFARAKSHLLLGGIAAAITGVCAYGLATRLFPGTYKPFFVDPEAIERFRLQEPLGYWNGLAIFAVMGVLLALGLAMDARSTPIRALAGASLVILLPTLYLTFSRGGWLALGIGLLAVLALAPRRLRFATIALALAPGPVIAVVVGSHLDGLTTPAEFERTARDGHTLAAVVAGLGVLAAVTAAAIGKVESRRLVSPALRRAWAALLVLVLVGGLISVSVRYGGPPTLARNAWRSFKGPGVEVKPGESLQKRLFTLSSSGRLDQWRVAWRDYAAHPALGSGAGSYEQRWYKYRPYPGAVRDAHGLYVEALAELGPVGLALLLVALGGPVVAAVRARRRPLVAAAAGAYAAYFVHAGLDWDWEMVAITLAALGIAGSLLVADGTPRAAARLAFRPRAGLLAATVAVWAFAVFGLLGNFTFARAEDRFDEERWGAAAVDSRTAIRWQPWSGEPWKQLGLAERGRGKLIAARRAFATATERDPGDWLKWINLGDASRGTAQRRAYAEAARLNPLSSSITARCEAGLVPRRFCGKAPPE